MKVAVRYYSRSGHTEKVAQELGKQLKVIPKTTATKLSAPVDILFVGSGTFFFKEDKHLKKFVSNLTPDQVKQIIIFGTAGGPDSMIKSLKKILSKKKLNVSNKTLFFSSFRLSPTKSLTSEQIKKISDFIANL